VDISGEGAYGKACRDIGSAGQGVGTVKASPSASDYIDALAVDYARARDAMRTRLS